MENLEKQEWFSFCECGAKIKLYEEICNLCRWGFKDCNKLFYK